VEITAYCPLARTMAARLRQDRDLLTRRWLDRIAARVELDQQRVFPTEEILDHVPLLVDGIADYLEDPTRAIASDVSAVAKAMELGALRYSQGFDEYEILKEYEIFGGVLYAYLAGEAERLTEPWGRGELVVCTHRLFRALTLIQQASVTHYLRLMKAQLKEREKRLLGFNAALSHELKNQIGAAAGALDLLEMEELPEAERARMLAVVGRNVRGLHAVLDNLLELTRLERDTAHDARRQRHVMLRSAIAEVVRQLRDSARAADVEIRVGHDLPRIEVPAATVELCLTNFLSNAIKYAEPSRAERWALIRATVREIAPAARADADGEQPRDGNGGTAHCEVVVEVHDNGLGVPESRRGRLFERFFRAHEQTVTGVEGTGLGLSLVRDAIEAVGGRAWAEFPEEGAVFAIALPCRREDDRRGAEGSPPA
jgi:signal transduction histidine kinase